MLVGSVGPILHDANVHRLTDRHSNRLSCLVIDEARRTFKKILFGFSKTSSLLNGSSV